MAFIRSAAEIANKWATVTPMRSGDYAFGIANPRTSWKTATMAAEGAYQDGVTKAMAAKSFGKGVSKAGDEKWQRKASTNGVARWGPGVQEAKGDYEAGFAPYREAIYNCKLPPRYARRDPRNLARVKAIVDALIAKKVSLMAK